MKIKTVSSWLPESEYVSFDVFDTLIKRSVAMPADLFLLIEQYCVSIGKEIPKEFAKKRREAEEYVCKKRGAQGCLDDIYDVMRDEFGAYTDELKAIELRLEMDGCRPNPSCAELLRRCLEAGKTVVLISDMYLPAAFIGKMLEKCGIGGYEKIYVSCEMGAQKGDGSLFRAVLNDLNIHPRQLFHIGDSWKGDLLRPLSMGIKVWHVDRGQKQLCKCPKHLPEEAAFSYRTLQACIRNCSQGMTENEKRGCRLFGPQLYGFAQWLLARLREDDIHDVYFMARDGYTLKQAFDELGTDDISTHYLYCSRRSFQVPLMWKHPQFDDVISLFAFINKMTVRTLLSKLGLTADDYEDQMRAYDLEPDCLYERGEIFSDGRVRAFYNSIQADVEQNSREEYEALVSYLRALNMAEKIAVVDIGWHGTMQYALERIIESEGWKIGVKGYYVGILVEGNIIREKRIQAKGYLFDQDKGQKLREGLYIWCPIEMQYLGNHGSVKRFVIEEGESHPVFYPYEYEKDKGQKVDEAAIMGAYQSGAAQFVRYLLSAFPFGSFEVSTDAAVHDFMWQGLKPTLKDAYFWGNMFYFDYENSYVARPKCIWYYLIHWKELRNDFLSCGWHIGFMRRLFLIPLPYDKIYFAMKKAYKRKYKGKYKTPQL